MTSRTTKEGRFLKRIIRKWSINYPKKLEELRLEHVQNSVSQNEVGNPLPGVRIICLNLSWLSQSRREDLIPFQPNTYVVGFSDDSLTFRFNEYFIVTLTNRITWTNKARKCSLAFWFVIESELGTNIIDIVSFPIIKLYTDEKLMMNIISEIWGSKLFNVKIIVEKKTKFYTTISTFGTKEKNLRTPHS